MADRFVAICRRNGVISLRMAASYRVFISSTYIDNRERRERVERAVIGAGMTPVGMDRFTASSSPTVPECQRMAAECDVFVCIIAHRYGWIPEGHAVSITELEYAAAKKAGRPRLMFRQTTETPVHIDREMDPPQDRWPKQALLDQFRKKYAADQMPAQFAEDNLSMLVLQALTDWRKTHEASARGSTAITTTTAPVEESDDVARYSGVAQEVHGAIQLAGFTSRLRVELDNDPPHWRPSSRIAVTCSSC